LKILKKLLSRVITKVILWDSQYFRKQLLLKHVVYGDPARIKIGTGVNLQNVVLNTNSGNITIGNFTFFGHDCMLLTGTHDPSLIGPQRINDHPIAGRDIVVGNNVWISSRAIVLGNVKISDNIVIAAGAVVTRDCTSTNNAIKAPLRRCLASTAS